MPKLPKPVASKPKPKSKAKSKERGKVIHSGQVEPIAGWTVTYQIIEDPQRTSEHNQDGRFVRLTGGTNWRPDVSVGNAFAYAAVVADAFDD